MNQRIRELLVKAEIEIKARRPALDEEPDGYVESDNDFMGNNCEAIIRLLEEGGLEKFAELIVLECVDIIEKLPAGYKDYRDQIEDAFRIASVVQIKQRFGVK